VHKTVNNFIKFVDGPTQMSRPRLFPGGTSETHAACFLLHWVFRSIYDYQRMLYKMIV
jgi:hypothetical protein